MSVNQEPAPPPRKFVKRPLHDQKHTLASRTRYKVDCAQFIGYVNTHTMRFGPHNELRITITVPAEFAEYALPVRYMGGLPLSIDIQKWRIAQPTPIITTTTRDDDDG